MNLKNFLAFTFAAKGDKFEFFSVIQTMTILELLFELQHESSTQTCYPNSIIPDLLASEGRNSRNIHRTYLQNFQESFPIQLVRRMN